MHTLEGASDGMADFAEAAELESEFKDVRGDLRSILSEIERGIVHDLVADTARTILLC